MNIAHSLETADDAKEIAEAVKECGRRMEKIAKERDAYVLKLERAAHAVLKARKRYRRSGQYPHIEFEDDGTTGDISDFGVCFLVSNGIDSGDDFGVTLTWDELALDPEAEGARATEAKRQAAIKEAEYEQTRIERRLKELKG